MTAIQIDDYVLAVDVDKTVAYYQTHALCDCDYCRNYYAQIKGKFPQFEAFLSQFGVDISRPDEICVYYEKDTCSHYMMVNYTVCGKAENIGPAVINISDRLPFSIGITNGFSSPNEQTSDYFTISLNNAFSLPWVLDRPTPKASKGSIKYTLLRFFQRIFKGGLTSL